LPRCGGEPAFPSTPRRAKGWRHPSLDLAKSLGTGRERGRV
jgi:hypothetical protein